MFEDIEKLLYQRYVLHTQKFGLVRGLDPTSYMNSVKTLNRIHLILNREILLNKKLYTLLQKEQFPEKVQKKFVKDAGEILLHINRLLVQENAVLCRTNVFSYSFSAAQKIVTGKQGYFQKKLKQFHRLAQKELVLHQDLFLLSQSLGEYSVDQEKVRRSRRLVKDLKEELGKLARSVGDSALVQKHGEHVLVLIGKLKKTEIYDFIQQDVKYIQTKVEYVMAHPKEHKIAYFLTTVYIVAPFTFEMTGVILFFRYIGKYTLIKTKTLKKKFTKKVSGQ